MKQKEEEKDEEMKETRETKEGAVFFFFSIEQKRAKTKGGRKLVRGRGGTSGTGNMNKRG